MTDFARKMQRKANDLALLMETESRRHRGVPNWNSRVPGRDDVTRTNIKPFYSPYANFDPEFCDTAVIGVNPGGNPRQPDTTDATYLTNLDKPRGKYNAYLDETWERAEVVGEAGLQQGVQTVFQTLYAPDEWDDHLRYAASLNVCPLRTCRATHIPIKVWKASVEWCLEVLEFLQPKRLICFAVFAKSGKPARRSPWHTFNHQFQIERKFCANVKRPNDKLPAFVYGGGASNGALAGCEVIGTPHLSYHHGNPLMFNALRDYVGLG